MLLTCVLFFHLQEGGDTSPQDFIVTVRRPNRAAQCSARQARAGACSTSKRDQYAYRSLDLASQTSLGWQFADTVARRLNSNVYLL